MVVGFNFCQRIGDALIYIIFTIPRDGNDSVKMLVWKNLLAVIVFFNTLTFVVSQFIEPDLLLWLTGSFGSFMPFILFSCFAFMVKKLVTSYFKGGHLLKVLQQETGIGGNETSAPSSIVESGNINEADMRITCTVCLDRPKCIVIQPCRHLCLCEVCTDIIKKKIPAKCPVCRQNVEDTMKIFN